MANMSKEQLLKINNACSNGWKLDSFYYACYGEKNLIKDINIDEENFLRFTLRYNYENQRTISISKYYQPKGKAYAETHGAGKEKILDTTKVKRKNINSLIELTNELDNNKLLEIKETATIVRGYGMITESEDF